MIRTTMEQLSIRFDAEMMRSIDAELERLRGKNPGLTLTRTDAVRSLVAAGIAERATFKETGRKRDT